MLIWMSVVLTEVLIWVIEVLIWVMDPSSGPAAGDDEEATTGPPLGCTEDPRRRSRPSGRAT